MCIRDRYDIPPLKAVSTVGAGDNFNAGIIYGLLKYDVRYDDLNTIGEAKWMHWGTKLHYLQ